MFDRGYESIPSNLADLQPGPELGGVLACIDVDRVSPYDRVIVLQARYRMRCYYDAELYRDMTAIVDAMGIEDPRWAAETASAEIQCALHLTRRASDRELSFALDLRQRYPRVWEALAEGQIDVWRAKMIAERTAHLSMAAAGGVVERIIAAAPNLTTGELKARLDRLCIEADPGSAKDRYDYAVDGRRVVSEAAIGGTANLLGLALSPHRVNAISRKINHIARSLKTGGETRTMDQLRADVYLDLLAGKTIAGNNDSKQAGSSGGGGVHLHTDLDTLTALAAHPGELAGYGPVIADVARQVAAELEDAEWRYSVTDTATGQPLHTGVTRRRPTAALRRDIEDRNPTCVFPGCRMPSVDCDLDHTRRWTDGGETSRHNLAPLCRRNHRIKDEAGWTYQRLANGDYQWTSRLGHTYTTSGTPP